MPEPLTLTSPVPTLDFSKPKRLVEYAADDPLYVLQETFKNNQLNDLKEAYRDWIHTALCSDILEYEYGENRAILMHFYEEVQYVIEAVFLIHKNNLPQNKNASHETGNHPADPIKKITSFYSSFSIDYVRRELWDWLHASLACGGNYAGNMNEYQALINYETLECLLEAAYILFKQSTEPPVTETAPANPAALSLQEAIAIIKEVCNPDKIFQLQHTPPGPKQPLPEYAFLALLPGSPNQSFTACQEGINEKCNGRATLSLFFEKTNTAYRFLDTGHIFYSVACTARKMVFNHDNQPIPVLPYIESTTIINTARNKFEQERKKSNAFLAAARHSFISGENNLAVFLLHQAAESILLGMLTTLTGENYYTHNLLHLLQKSCCFTRALKAAFPQNNPEEIALLQLLNNAYIQTRYKNCYTITDTELKKLVDRVALLQDNVAQAIEQQLAGFKLLFNQ